RVGGNKPIKIDCRIICATNKDLEKLVEKNEFRLDLYYRINVIDVTIPPLRERREEIVILIRKIVEEMNNKYQMQKEFSSRSIVWMSKQKWVGNVRELRNFIEKKIITSTENTINLEQLLENQELTNTLDNSQQNSYNSLKSYMEAAERQFIIDTYKDHPNSVQLAKRLGISQSTADRKIKKYVKPIN